MKTQLRDHPSLNEEGVGLWPPIWLRTGGNETATAIGEVGVLRDVKTHDADLGKVLSIDRSQWGEFHRSYFARFSGAVPETG